MYLRELLKHIEDKALEIKNVASFSVNDVYETYNATDILYSNITFSLMRTERSENVMRHTFMVYYADRLLMFGKNNNKLEIQEQGMTALLSLINSLDDEITYTLPINFVPFEQQFADYLAGIYAEVTLETSYAMGDCLLTDFDDYYTVQYYDYEGGTLLKKEIVREGESVEPPTQPSREHYKFLGWSDTSENVRQDKVIYGLWSEIVYSVKFYNYQNGELVSEQFVAEGGDAVTPPTPTYEHYTFLGWSGTATNVHEDKVIYGNWTAVLIINPTTSGTMKRSITTNKYDLQYSRDLNEWSDWSYNASITINANNPLYIRGHYLSGESTKWFTTNFDFTVSGTLRGLSYNADFTSYNTSTSFSIGSRCLNYVFRDCEGLKSAVDLEIPYIKNGGWAYGIFYNCPNLEEVVVTSLTKASTASTSNDFGYFLYGCKNLKRLTIQQSGAGATRQWLVGANDRATIVLPSNHPLINEPRGTSAIPSGWTIETF